MPKRGQTDWKTQIHHSTFLIILNMDKLDPTVIFGLSINLWGRTNWVKVILLWNRRESWPVAILTTVVGKRVITKLLNNNIPPSEVVAQLSGHNNLLSLNQYNSVYTKTMGNVNRNPSCQQWCFYNEDITDAELLAASQEIEETLQTIEIFEHFNNQIGYRTLIFLSCIILMVLCLWRWHLSRQNSSKWMSSRKHMQ